ncbi:hypothetical protein Tco_0834795 [Tanacetum coccineum]
MSNTNNNLQTQTSNDLHNAIMEAGGKDYLPMLTLGNYVQWKSKIKRYIDTKPNIELIHYCLQNPPYKFKWIEKTVPVAEGIDYDIYSTVNACLNACEMWKAIKRLKQGESINFLLQLQLEWQRFVTLVKQSQELKTVFYHKLYDILKQHHNEVNEIRAKRLARTANPFALVAQQQSIYHPQNYPNHYTQNYSTISQPAATRNRDDEMSKEKEIDKLMALISLSFKKIYKPTNNNLRTSSNTSRANQDNTPRINRGIGYDNQRAVNVVGARENVEQADWRDDTDDEPDDQESEAHYMYMAQIQEVTLDDADNFGPIFDIEPLQKVQNDDDNYNVFANDREHPEQPESVNDAYLEEQGNTNITIDSLDMSTNGETVDQDDDHFAKECDLLASLIEKLKCEINDNKNHNKYLESSNKALVDKLKGVNPTTSVSSHSLRAINCKIETKMPMAVPISTREPKRIVNQSVATPLKRTVASESTNQKPRSKIRKKYEQIRIKSRNTTISEPTTLRKSTISNTPSSSNSFAARRDNYIHHRLWVLKAYDRKSQAFK